MEVIFLPLLASSSPSLVQKQPEIASAMFAVLRHHRQWLLMHMLLNKVATSLIPASRDMPVALQQPLTKLTAPADPDGIPVVPHRRATGSRAPPTMRLLEHEHAPM